MLYTRRRKLSPVPPQNPILSMPEGLREGKPVAGRRRNPKFPRGRPCARLVPHCRRSNMSQANPVRLFVTHVWENSDDYLRVFEYLESARNFFYKNYSTPDRRPNGDKEALREDLRRQISPVEAVVALSSLHAAQP